MDFRKQIGRLRRTLYRSQGLRNRSGSSLVEVVVAAFLLSLLLVFAVRPLLSTVRNSEFLSQRQQGELLAHQVMERALLTPLPLLRAESGEVARSVESRGSNQSQTLSWQLFVDSESGSRDYLIRVEVTGPNPVKPVVLTSRRPILEKSHG